MARMFSLDASPNIKRSRAWALGTCGRWGASLVAEWLVNAGPPNPALQLTASRAGITGARGS